MNCIVLTFDDKRNCARQVNLPASKSEQVRLELLRVLAGSNAIGNRGKELGEPCNDVLIIRKALKQFEAEVAKQRIDTLQIDIEDAGTAMRFLTAYFAYACRQAICLTGSERMQKRPIAALVDALRTLGAKISYCKEPGYPPLLIEPAQLQAKSVTLDAHISSQFLSALMLIAPMLKDDLLIRLKGKQVSADYPRLTARMMRSFGANVQEHSDAYLIKARPYNEGQYEVEADWSAAGYLYNMMLLQAPGSKLLLKGLRMDSIQADQQTARLWLPLGIRTEAHTEGVMIYRTQKLPDYTLEEELSQCPDLVPALLVACLLSETRFAIRQIDGLRLKECDRIEALQSNLKRLGYELSCTQGSMSWNGVCTGATGPVSIDVYQDHRIAMALSALAARVECGIRICQTNVVTKSYPQFWQVCQEMGFNIEESFT